MKRHIALRGIILLTVAAMCAACEGSGMQEPTVVDRAILTDAVWSAGDDVSQDAACVADSKLRFEGDVNPLTIALNGGGDERITSPVVVVEDLQIRISEYEWDVRGGDCDGGSLYYVVPASPDDPIALECSDPRCGFEKRATEKGTETPITLFIYGHLEALEGIAEDAPPSKMVKLVVDYCGSLQ